MTYIRTGLITVTNGEPVITGVGTKFITDQVLVGDAIYIGAEGVPYDVASVNSQTSLGLAIPYAGTSGSGKKYVVMPVQGHNHELAKQARELVRSYKEGVAKEDLDVAIATKVDKVTGKQLSDQNYSLAEKSKLAGIATGATKNATDVALRDRALHTGAQAISTVTGLQTALDGKVGTADARLTNSREWTTETISQAEAEAGTSTTRRAWTAQRNKQAFTAYLKSVSTGKPSTFSWNRVTDTLVSHYYDEVYSPQARMKRCLVLDNGDINYYLDPLDSNFKEDGTPSVLTGADGQVMVQIPRTYVNVKTVGDVVTWSTSPVPLPRHVIHPAFTEGGTLELDTALGMWYYKNPTKVHEYIYYSAYGANVQNSTGYVDGLNLDDNRSRVDLGADKLSSVSGSYPMIGLTIPEIRDLAKNRGAGWQGLDFWTVSLVQMLFVTQHASLNTQAVLGDGNTSSTYLGSSSNQEDSPHTQAGKSNTIGNKSGFLNSYTKSTAWMSYNGIEHWYGNCLYGVDGIVINDRANFVTNKPENFVTDSVIGLTLVGAVNSDVNGFIRQTQESTLGFIPQSVSGGSNSVAYSDHYYQATGFRVLWFGGHASTGGAAGGFYWLATDAGVHRSRTRGVRFLFKR